VRLYELVKGREPLAVDGCTYRLASRVFGTVLYPTNADST